MKAQNLTPEIICERSGLFMKSFQWIMTNGFASEDAMERLAEAAGAKVGELLLPDISGTVENAIEFIKGFARTTVTFSQPRYINRIKELAEKYPEDCEIVAINKNAGEGESICAHIPTAWVKINPPRKLTDEQKEELTKRLRADN